MREYISMLNSKCQVTIPVEIRRLLGLRPHDKIVFLLEGDQVWVASATSVVAHTAGTLGSDEPRLSQANEKVAIEEAMAEEAEVHQF